MQTGTKISAIAHVTLVSWAFIGGVFDSEPLPFEVQEVSVISAEDFAALSTPTVAPEVVDQPSDLQAPEVPVEEAALPTPSEPEPEQQRPDPVTQPEPDPIPEPVIETPVPEPDVPVSTPSLAVPEPDVQILPISPAIRPKPRPVERVAPQPVAAPPPDVAPDEVEKPAVVAGETGEIKQEEQEATAPEEATDQIVPDAEETANVAPTRSVRPQARRPARPKPEEPTQQASTPSSGAAQQDAVNSALAEALAGEPEPSGPPLTSGEKDDLRIAVSSCWNVGSLSTEALGTTVVVGVSVSREGKPDIGSIQLLDSSGGSTAAANQAFGAARRAIIRCGAKGFNLPAEKYGQWRNIEMTFNPERMRIK
ncbi:energy transducer TonB [Phaeobacter gallaeciensis]|uniref:Energy transducer TonB n=2 Tax=Roseobacteraceae TaxID=2854170 RepID=A0A366X8K0_9RHOB|nr:MULTISPECIES: energy transducer TonB [Roseobacteraceae]MBT3142681.1 energy transducer TonB [Falsiruegeria litorea]MBT8168205.1 energy transducer TonB [Falsiruegeria litorea]RBW61562.1 energy transducer TonB [Phaeobacter gallaeciensis]